MFSRVNFCQDIQKIFQRFPVFLKMFLLYRKWCLKNFTFTSDFFLRISICVAISNIMTYCWVKEHPLVCAFYFKKGVKLC